MSPQSRTWRLKKAVDLIDSDPGRSWSIGELAGACGVAPRTLHQHFRRSLGRTPVRYLRDVRLERVRQELLRASLYSSVTEIASRNGFSHFGRFARWYRERFGETPSTTLQSAHIRTMSAAQFQPLVSRSLDRPTVRVLAFELVGPEARYAAGMAEEIAAALLRIRWIAVLAGGNARYRLCGKVRGDGMGRLRVTVMLVDNATARIRWADHWEGRADDAFEFELRVASRAARAIESALRRAEIARAARKEGEALDAWELTMRALPGVLSYDAAAEAEALELLERAMELAPSDPLPISLAAWCRGVRGCLNFTPRAHEEKRAGLALAARAVSLNSDDALTEIALAAGYTLANDLTTAAVHADHALTLDGGSAWAWSRSGWISAFSGDGRTAIERLQIARAIAPADPLSAMCCFGICSPYYEAGRFGEAIPWIKRGIAESPRTAVWMSPFLAAAYAMESRKDEAKRTLGRWRRAFPDMSVAQLRSGLPFSSTIYDRVAEGLESLGMKNSR